MWHTQEGDRVLKGAEAHLFATGVWVIMQGIEAMADEPDDEGDSGVDAFDRLSRMQRLAMLRDVTKALLDKSVPAPRLTAVNEATVAAVFEVIQMHTTMEIEMSRQLDRSERYLWREDLLKTYREVYGEQPDPNFPLPRKNSRDTTDWELVIGALSERILWDDDWNLESGIVDCPPELAQLQMTVLTIDDEYFQGIAPDPPDSKMPAILEELRALCELV
jgi:hypothetical protein